MLYKENIMHVSEPTLPTKEMNLLDTLAFTKYWS